MKKFINSYFLIIFFFTLLTLPKIEMFSLFGMILKFIYFLSATYQFFINNDDDSNIPYIQYFLCILIPSFILFITLNSSFSISMIIVIAIATLSSVRFKFIEDENNSQTLGIVLANYIRDKDIYKIEFEREYILGDNKKVMIQLNYKSLVGGKDNVYKESMFRDDYGKYQDVFELSMKNMFINYSKDVLDENQILLDAVKGTENQYIYILDEFLKSLNFTPNKVELETLLSNVSIVDEFHYKYNDLYFSVEFKDNDIVIDKNFINRELKNNFISDIIEDKLIAFLYFIYIVLESCYLAQSHDNNYDLFTSYKDNDIDILNEVGKNLEIETRFSKIVGKK